MPPRRPRRRMRGTGSIEVLPSGRYRARYAGDGDTFDTELDADRWLLERRTSPASRRNTGRAFDAVIDEWWLVVERSVKPRTAERYDDYANIIRRELGTTPIDAVDARVLQIFVGRLQQTYAPKTVRGAHAVARLILSHAHRMGEIAAMPPKVVLPRVERPTLTIPTRGQVDELALASNAMLWAPVIVAGYCGLREGELLALLRVDVHIDDPVPWLLVRHARNKTSGRTESTKTGRIRRVYMPTPVVDALRVHFDEHDGDLVVPVSASVLQKSWGRARRACDLDGVRFHDLRHSAASMMIAAGLNVLQVSKQLGHANPTQTLNTYGHLWPDSFDDAMRLLDKYLAGG